MVKKKEMSDIKKGFTLIELVVVIAIISILVLLGSGLYKGYTKQAELTKHISYVKELESASERYYMKEGKWPRLGDIPYTADEIVNFSAKIKDITGEDVVLDPTGNYYDLDYAGLSRYTKTPVDKGNYILQNPVGRIYYLEELTEHAVVRVPKETEVIPDGPIEFAYTGEMQAYTISETGDYLLEVWGAEGGTTVGGTGGKGGYARGIRRLTKDEIIYIYVGGKGNNGRSAVGGWNGGGSSSGGNGPDVASGGGATDIRTEQGIWNNYQSLSSRLIVAGGGGGGAHYNTPTKGGAGGGTTGGNGQLNSVHGGSFGYGGTKNSGGASPKGVGGGLGYGGGHNTGGGGGGYYGGGSGQFLSSGGGGSSYIGGLTEGSTSSGVNVGNGKALITYIGK